MTTDSSTAITFENCCRSSLVQTSFNNAQNVAESDFGENFFPAESARDMPEIDVFPDFQWIFSIYFFVFFTQRHN